MKYKAGVNDRYEFELDDSEVSHRDAVPLKQGGEHLLSEQVKYMVSIEKSVPGKKYYEVSVNGNLYRVNLSDSLDLLIAEMGLNRSGSHKEAHVKSPMPGLILEVLVEVGEEVEEGTPLLILEAMKMENSITAPISGKVVSLSVSKGDSVEKGSVLIEIE
jgi:biotin carboxyl carrier protein